MLKAFADAARLIRGEALGAADEALAREALGRLGLADERTAGPLGPPEHRARLLAAASRLRHLFQLDAPKAPALALVGGVTDPASYGGPFVGVPSGSVSGRGRTTAQAFASCIGEAVEQLSLVRPPEGLRWMPPEACPEGMAAEDRATLSARLAGASGPIAWRPARALVTDRETWFPVAACGEAGRRPAGCAAAPTREAATLGALLEVIERDAAALWWVGARPPAIVAAESAAGAFATLERLRAGRTARRSWLLDLTTDLGVPCLAAVSIARDGRDVACGLAARTSLPEAAEAAVLELCQMELSNHLVAMKRRQERPLTEAEARRGRCVDTLDVARSPILAPTRPPGDAPALDGAPLAALAGRLAASGLEAYAIDLTDVELGIPCVLVSVPGLQALPVATRTPRLAGAIAEHGGRGVYPPGLDLL